MSESLVFLFNSIMMGLGFSADEFSVSVINGVSEPDMRRKKMFVISGIFAVFQAIMLLIGWICIHTISTWFQSFGFFIPWIALILLVYAGIKAIREGMYKKEHAEESEDCTISSWMDIIIQGIATSIDTLMAGFTVAEQGIVQALETALIIGVITFIVCFIGVAGGKKIGTRYAFKADIVGGIILILLGINIFLNGIL